MENIVLYSLHKKRIKWVLANQENDFEEGINNLLTEFYPDNAHFIYELLQNAEDAGAKKVSFNLQKDKVIFIHNGAKLFDEKDVTAITKIGKGTKRDDINKIGKFGVGFKAVFSYTDSPRIFSGEYNFEIRNLVVPYEINPVSKNKDETVFHFPFNSTSKPKDAAYSEVKKGLLDLNPITLLFLSSIIEIEINIDSLNYKIHKKEEKNDPFVIISDSLLNELSIYLKFKKYLPNNDHLYVSIAFKLEKDGKTGKKKISLIENGEVAIFFPAEKETSNLKFHIHAPFASTVARDSIKDREENTELIKLISELLCEATAWAKKNDLLDFDFIKCLPIDDDNLSEFYKPIQDKIVDLFKRKDYLPCDNEQYQAAKYCYRATKRIKDVIDISTLKVLKDIDDTIFWVRNPTQRNSREDKFIQSLSLETIDEEIILESIKNIVDDYVGYIENEYNLFDELENVIDEYKYYDEKLYKKLNEIIKKCSDNITLLEEKLIDIVTEANQYDEDFLEAIQNVLDEYNEYKNHKIKKIIENKSNDWLKSFYEFLFYLIEKQRGEYQYSYYKQPSHSNFKIFIKLENGNYNYGLKECYFPSSTRIESLKSRFVDRITYESDKKDKNNSAKLFLEHVGVKEISLEQEVKYILEEEYSKEEILYDDHLNHLQLFLKYYIEERDKLYSLNKFEIHKCLKNSENKFAKPCSILIDEPWEKTGLKIINGCDDKFLLNELYNEKLTSKEKGIFLEFLKSIGCKFSVPIEKKRIWSHPKKDKLRDSLARESEYCISEDFDFSSGIRGKLKSNDYDFSLLIWNNISNIKDVKVFTARYRPNQSSKINTDDSSLIYTLAETKWIPDKDGKFYKPADISKDNLDRNFIIKDDNGWITKVGLGKNKEFSKKKYKQTNEILEKKFGWNITKLEELKAAGITEDDLNDLIDKKKSQNKISTTPNLKEGITKHTRNIPKNENLIDPDIIIDEENYRKKIQDKLNKNLKKSKKEHKFISSRQKVKVGINETKEFLKHQYHGCCQICGFTFDQIGYKGKYFKVFDWLSEKISYQKTNIIEAGSSLCLCSRCHSILKYGDFEVKAIDEIKNIEESNYNEFANNFNLTISESEVPDVFSFIEMDMFKIPIRLLNQDSNIFYSEEHFLHFFNMLTLKDNLEINDFEEEDDTHRTEIIDQSYSTEEVKSGDGVPQNSYNSNVSSNNDKETNEKTEISENENIDEQVKSGDTVYVKYLNSNQELELKLVDYQPNIRSKNGINEISSSSPFGKKVIGKSVGTVFNLGVNQIKILDIVR
jgi:hypothetical protein